MIPTIEAELGKDSLTKSADEMNIGFSGRRLGLIPGVELELPECGWRKAADEVRVFFVDDRRLGLIQ